MSRAAYDEIKQKFNVFIASWKSLETVSLESIVDKNVKCYLSVIDSYTDGSCHSSFGLKFFIENFPKGDVFHSRICNFVCRTQKNQAQQSAAVVCRALKIVAEEVESFEFTALFSNAWEKQEEEWQLKELRMDIVPHNDVPDDFKKIWYFDRSEAGFYSGVHLPCILGEMDSPWIKIPETDTVLTEKEVLAEAVYKHNFGLDHLVFDHTRETLAEDFFTMNANFGGMDKRNCLAMEKFHRQKNRYWAHPYHLTNITIQQDSAQVDFYRMAGHTQRKQPYNYTMENLDREYACAKGKMTLIKEEQQWRILKMEYFLGLYDWVIDAKEMRLNN